MNLDQLIEELGKKHEIVVGFPKDKQVVYPPSDRKGHHNKGGQTVAQVAAWNEFGTKTKEGKPHIPSRPFLRTALRKNRDNIRKLIALSFSLENITNPQRFDIIGDRLVSMVKDSIINGDWVQNAEYTQRQKLKLSTRKLLNKNDAKSRSIVENELKKMKPLIDTGLMKSSVSYEVRSL